MTASRKSIIILFFALIAGYLVGSIILLLLYHALSNFISGEAYSILSTFTGLIWLYCYPPLAISYLFYHQVGNPFSRWGMILSLIIALSLFLAMIFEFQAHLLNNKQAGLVYFLVPVPIVVLLSCLVIGFACINEKQRQLTQIFGYSTLISIAIFCLFSLIFFALSYVMNPASDYTFFAIVGGIVFDLLPWFGGLSVLVALICAVFLGLKEDEHSA